MQTGSCQSGYGRDGQGDEALKIFAEMRRARIDPDEYAFTSVLRACAGIGALEEGYAELGRGDEALELFGEMQRAGVRPDPLAFNSVLCVCATCEHGKQFHSQLIRTGFELDVSVRNALVVMYLKCGCLDDARQVFEDTCERDVALWSSMIAGYVQRGFSEAALTLFAQMQRANAKPDQLIFASVLWACTGLVALEQGKQVHAVAIRYGLDSYASVANALIDMYNKSGNIEYACQVFDKMPERNIVSWSVKIAGDAQHGYCEEAMKLFCQMLWTDAKPDQFIFTNVLRACAGLVALEQGLQAHAHIIRSGFELDVFVGSALVDMYAKCGNIEEARQVFNQMGEQNVVSWTVMISGYAQNGHGLQAIQLFEEMLLAGIKPDHITFVGVLHACSHAGLVDEGRHYFYSMSQDHSIEPMVEHYACMVDLLGRAGFLDQAKDFINKMPLEPDAIVWGAFLGACRIHGNIELGKCAAEQLFELEPYCVATHVLLANIYAEAGRWEDAAIVRKMMMDKGLKKPAGQSRITVNERVHAFVADDRSHPQTEEIYVLLERLAKQLKQAGYVPDTNFMLHDVEE